MNIEAMLEITRLAMQELYADMLPVGFSIYKVAEYDPVKFPAPNLWWEKRQKPGARYVVILTSDTESVPALGDTVADAINTAIAKIEHEQHGSPEERRYV